MRALQNLKSLPLVFGCFLLVGCYGLDPTTPSGAVATKDLSAEIHVTNNQSQIVNVEMMLRSGTVTSGNDVYLSNGDSLYASIIGDFTNIEFSGDQFVELEYLATNVRKLKEGRGRSSLFFPGSSIWYYEQFPISTKDKEFTLILTRTEKLGAHNSTVTLPTDFHINSPLSGESFSRSNDIVVSWDSGNADTTMRLLGLLTCDSVQATTWNSDQLQDIAGTFTIPANTFANYSGGCSLTIRLDRRDLGVLDSNFALGGIIVGHQVRAVVINTTP